MAANESYGPSPHTVEQRLDFYLTYLHDVVPYGVNVCHIPRNHQPFELRLTTVRSRTVAPIRREEIQLRYEGRVFMTCVLSLDCVPINAEQIGGHLACTHYRDGYFVRDYHRAWRMFTALKHEILQQS